MLFLIWIKKNIKLKKYIYILFFISILLFPIVFKVKIADHFKKNHSNKDIKSNSKIGFKILLRFTLETLFQVLKFLIFCETCLILFLRSNGLLFGRIKSKFFCEKIVYFIFYITINVISYTLISLFFTRVMKYPDLGAITALAICGLFKSIIQKFNCIKNSSYYKSLKLVLLFFFFLTLMFYMVLVYKIKPGQNLKNVFLMLSIKILFKFYGYPFEDNLASNVFFAIEFLNESEIIQAITGLDIITEYSLIFFTFFYITYKRKINSFIVILIYFWSLILLGISNKYLKSIVSDENIDPRLKGLKVDLTVKIIALGVPLTIYYFIKRTIILLIFEETVENKEESIKILRKKIYESDVLKKKKFFKIMKKRRNIVFKTIKLFQTLYWRGRKFIEKNKKIMLIITPLYDFYPQIIFNLLFMFNLIKKV